MTTKSNGNVRALIQVYQDQICPRCWKKLKNKNMESWCKCGFDTANVSCIDCYYVVGIGSHMDCSIDMPVGNMCRFLTIVSNASVKPEGGNNGH